MSLNAAVIVSIGQGAATVNSFNTGDAQSPWTLDVSLLSAAPSMLVFSDPDGDVLGPSGARSISITITNLTGQFLQSFEFRLGSGLTFDPTSFTGFQGPPLYNCCSGTNPQWVNSFFPPVGNGGLLVRGFVVESSSPVASFAMELTSNSNVIPEPSSAVLVAAGALAYWIRRRA